MADPDPRPAQAPGAENSADRWRRGPLIAATLVTAAFLAAVVWNLSDHLRGPAPWPQEWRWGLRGAPPARGWGWAAVWALALLALLLVTGTGLFARRRRWLVPAVLAATATCCFAFQYSLVSMADGRSAADVLVKRTQSPSFTSVYSVAMHPGARDVGYLLREYDVLLPHMPGHAKVHPPGRVLYFRGLLELLERNPDLTDSVLRLGEALDATPDPAAPPAPATHFATALLGVLLLMALTSLSSCAVAGLAGALGFPAGAALRTGILWALVPGFALMTPTFDQLLALPVTGVAALLALSYRTESSGPLRWSAALAAGALAGVALFLSFGAALFLIFGGLVTVAAMLPSRPRPLTRVLLPTAAAAGLAAATFFLPMVLGYDPLAALALALDHHGNQITALRSRGVWMIYNLLDLAIFLGVPLALLWLWRAGSSARDLVGPRGARRMDTAGAYCLAVTLGLLLIDLSGTVRGEVGRIWIPLLPFLAIAALWPKGAAQRGAGSAGGPARLVPPAILLVLLACICVTLRTHWHLP